MKPQLLLPLLTSTLFGNPFHAPLKSLHEYNQKNLLAALEMIPPADLNYRPTAEVRSLRELIGHIVDVHYLLCSEAKGEPNPQKKIDATEKANLSKPELVQALKQSSAYCAPAFEKPDDTRAKSLTLVVYHSGQHYGNLVTYVRLRGLKPPSAPGAAGSQTAESKKLPAMTRYYMGFLKKGPKYTTESTPDLQRLQEAHLGHIRKMGETGKLIIAGPFADDGDIRGILIFRTASAGEARALAEADPMVETGRLQLELHPWFAPKGVLPE